MDLSNIQCPVCGNTELEPIEIYGRDYLRWMPANETNFRSLFTRRSVEAIACIRCSYILLFAESSRKRKE
jgi:hypothetical protein